MSIENNHYPSLIEEEGAEHPVNQVKNFILSLLRNYGFDFIDGPEIETEEFNFDLLNIKKSHPARQMHDTFYVQNKSHLLRTHTSPLQEQCFLKIHHFHMLLVVKFIEKMTTQLTCQCFIK